jgi:hypothetical protein
MLLKASQIDSYGSIRQGLEEAAVKKTLNLNFTGLLLSVCKVSIQFAINSNLVDLLTELMLNKYARSTNLSCTIWCLRRLCLVRTIHSSSGGFSEAFY